MTEESIRTAIAEACGLRVEVIETGGYYAVIHRNEKHPNGHQKSDSYICKESAIRKLPNYPQDLNAIHEARKAIVTTTELRVKYLNTLRAIVGKRCPKNKTGASLVTDYDLINAEAWEHAETLVKVAGKWVES